MPGGTARISMMAMVVWIFLAAGPVRGDESLADKACRSVHLNYEMPAATAFHQKITVRESAPGTYFAVCGWNQGYFGIQELGDGKKVVIFSVWDSSSNDPNAQADDKRVRILAKDPAVRTSRFGGEGSGGKSFFDLDWKIGETVECLLVGRPDGKRAAYSGYIRPSREKEWKHLITFSSVKSDARLTGLYSFVEDFRRNGQSAKQARRAEYGPGWVRTAQDGTWLPIAKARFTADSNPAVNVDAAALPELDGFFLATGGATRDGHAALKSLLELPARERTPPQGWPALDVLPRDPAE